MISLERKRYHWLLFIVFTSGFLVRYLNIMSLSTGHDHALLIFWSRMVAEASELGLSSNLIHSLLQASTEQVISLLLLQQNSLIYALLYGLYENPEKITRIIDVVSLACWFKLVGYGIFQARILSILLQLGTVWMTYLLALRVTGNRLIAFLSLILMSFLPMSVLFSRFVSWHTFGSFFFILAVYAGVIGVDKRIKEGKYFCFYFSSLLWGVAALSNTLIPVLIPLIVGGYLLIIMHSRMKDKLKLFFSWLCPGLVFLLPAFVFLSMRSQEFFQRNLGYEYWNQNFYEKVAVQIASWNDIISLPLMMCVISGIVLALNAAKKNRVFYIPLLWTLFHFALFSFISTETLFRAHLNVLPPLVFFASFSIVAAWDWLERRDLMRCRRIYIRIGMGIALLLVMLPNSIALCKILKNPYHDPFVSGKFKSYLHPLEAEENLIDYIEKELPAGSVLFISAGFIHSMNVQLKDREKYTFINLTALYLNHKGKNYKRHLEKFYPKYREDSPHYIITQHSEFPLEVFTTLEPSAHFPLITKIGNYKLFRIEFFSHSEENNRTH